MKNLIWFLLPILTGCAGHMRNVMIDKGNAAWGPEEPSICVNPSNPENIIAGSNIRNAYYSFNSGRSWQKITLSSSHGVYGDPCVIADPRSGDVYFLHLSDPEGKGWASDSLLDRIVCQRSDDGGKTWNDGGAMGVRHPKDQDKEWAIVNPWNGEVYATWTQFDSYGSSEPEDSSLILFSKSTDRGETWSEPLRLSGIAGTCLDDDNTVEGAVPAVGPNGEIYVSWALGDKIYFDRSLDGGNTWLANDMVVTEGTGGWELQIPGLNRANGMPVTVCDLSNSPSKGTIYVNWSDTRNGADNTDIWIASSADGGNTWSEPVRINNDTTTNHQFLTWMTIDQVTGVVYIVFYDRRNYDDLRTDVYLAYSRDGGQSFKNIQISDSAFIPAQTIFFGDYNNISAHNNVVRPVWTRLDDNQLSIWTCLINGKKLD